MANVTPDAADDTTSAESFTSTGTGAGATPDQAVPDLDLDEGLRSLVLDTAPRLFAVVLEFSRGTPDADGVVMAWGLADEDGARVIDTDGRRTLHLASPERALWWYRGAEGARARLVWLAEPDSAVLDTSANEVTSRAEAA